MSDTPEPLPGIDIFRDFKGLLLQINADGVVTEGRLVRSVEEVRGRSANLVIWLDSYATSELRIAALSIGKPLINDIAKVVIITKSKQ